MRRTSRTDLRFRSAPLSGFCGSPATERFHWYVQLHNKLPKTRIPRETSTEEFDRLVDAALAEQIALYGDGTQTDVEKPRGRMILLPVAPPVQGPGPLRTGITTAFPTIGSAIPTSAWKIKQNTRDARMGLVEPLIAKHGEVRWSCSNRMISSRCSIPRPHLSFRQDNVLSSNWRCDATGGGGGGGGGGSLSVCLLHSYICSPWRKVTLRPRLAEGSSCLALPAAHRVSPP